MWILRNMEFMWLILDIFFIDGDRFSTYDFLGSEAAHEILHVFTSLRSEYVVD